ncbi:MAG: hypothetical protein N2040_04230, partial [Caldimonas manganoxidans]|nr:hypothetical protein [Caldimonas manganoxidans]
RKRSNPADASAAAAKVICFMTVIIAAHHQGDKTDYCQAQDLISVSLGDHPRTSLASPRGRALA